ncbi:hypothetical protein [Pseudomonas fluorescens]|uniref:hypothetical protein n=1 Tax=Pseudomonas fluorescens TaxID=294 RepID=UPI001BEA62FD|nr:hypothetical protein [Pseudomonas fluorescens]MBT2371064.1 hypothetical protein [Pseudomonas fluorescens]
MLDSQEIENKLLSASGRFEYTVDGGAVVIPTYKYASFYMGNTHTFFVGRDTDVAIQETGVHMAFTYESAASFWGVDTSLGGGIVANFHSVGEVWRGQTGIVTGIFSSSQKTVFIQFDFMAHRDSRSKHVKGHFILKADGVSS